MNVKTVLGSGYPSVRLRRLRKSEAIRNLFQEVRLSAKELAAPVFVQEGISKPVLVNSMPEIRRIPLRQLNEEIQTLVDIGINTVILFGIPAKKDNQASSAYSEDGIVQQSVELIKKQFGDKVTLITDVCLCQYTTHGHCGLLEGRSIDNDMSIQALARVAVSHAGAGADIVAPSAMMDGQVKSIREALDDRAFHNVAIMGYSAKFASALYTPFRDIAGSTPEFGNRKSYQMPLPNAREAMRELEHDVMEGADILMIKPALPCLDLIYRARQRFDLPLCAYSVSGEYALIKAASKNGWLDEQAVTAEFVMSIKRAGADIIITYFAKQVASMLAR